LREPAGPGGLLHPKRGPSGGGVYRAPV